VTPEQAGEPDGPALRVLLVDDHDLFAEPLTIALGLHGLVVEVAPLDSAEHVVATAERFQADLVLLDLDLGGAIGTGASLVAPVSATGSRVLIVTGSEDTNAIGNALALGAVGVVFKHESFERLVNVVVAAARGEAVMDIEERRRLLQSARSERSRVAQAHAPFTRLSTREAQVLRALADGRTVSDIAAGWVVSEATVRTQVRGVLTKLGVTTQLAAVAHARRTGWLSDLGPDGVGPGRL
jgi:DNA-binding NarL/FixJ family response regulator